MGIDPKDYVGRPQAYVKHEVLDRYLLRLALKVAQFAPGTTLNYIDGFSGPWHHGVPLESDRPTSPHVALAKLRSARDQLRARNIELRVRCLFVENDPEAFARLESMCAASRGIETLTICGDFEAHIHAAVDFAKAGPKPFAFIFIDPTGWTGFGLQRIAPLLRVEPSEVLVNFMLKDILRFVDDKRAEIVRGFEDLFGQQAEEYRARWRALHGLDREDAIVGAYCDRLRMTCGFTHVTSAVVLNPRVDRTHYHLVYATRSRRGLVTFREVEQQVMRVQDSIRAIARRTEREARTGGQKELFSPLVNETPYVEMLVQRYHACAKTKTLLALGAVGEEVPYEKLIDAALEWPMTSEAMLKDWVAEWQREDRVDLVGLDSRARVPRIGAQHRVRRKF